MPTWEAFSNMIKAYPSEAIALVVVVIGLAGFLVMWFYEHFRIAGYKEEIERLKGRSAHGGKSAEVLKQERLLDKQRRTPRQKS
jgi:hypothetical protein